MKKAILASAITLLAPLANAGSADIPGWHISDHGYTCLRISNSSSAPAEVTVHLYDTDGSEYLGGITGTNYISNLGQPYTVPPMATSSFCVTRNGLHIGFGSIEAQVADGYTGKTRMLAHGLFHTFGSPQVTFSIPINGGMPF